MSDEGDVTLRFNRVLSDSYVSILGYAIISASGREVS